MRARVRVRLYSWVRATSVADICSEGLRILHDGVLCSIWLIENGNRQRTQIAPSCTRSLYTYYTLVCRGIGIKHKHLTR